MTNTFDAHALADLLRLSRDEFLAMMRQEKFPSPTISPKGRFYWSEATWHEWTQLAEKFKAEKKQKTRWASGLIKQGSFDE